MDFQYILYEKHDGVAVVKLNRPVVLNAMNKTLWLDVKQALIDAKKMMRLRC